MVRLLKAQLNELSALKQYETMSWEENSCRLRYRQFLRIYHDTWALHYLYCAGRHSPSVCAKCRLKVLRARALVFAWRNDFCICKIRNYGSFLTQGGCRTLRIRAIKRSLPIIWGWWSGFAVTTAAGHWGALCYTLQFGSEHMVLVKEVGVFQRSINQNLRLTVLVRKNMAVFEEQCIQFQHTRAVCTYSRYCASDGLQRTSLVTETNNICWAGPSKDVIFY